MTEETLHRKKTPIIFVLLSCLLLSGCKKDSTEAPSATATPPKTRYLKDYYRDYFDIGAAVQYYSIDNGKYEDLMPHFSTLTCENEMKWGKLEAQRGSFTYEGADKIVAYAQKHGKKVRGHTLLWHKSLPNWIKEECTTKEKALNLIDSHIKAVMGHFKDTVYCYDVVNEALHNTVSEEDIDNGNYFRTGTEISGTGTMDWYSLCGFDYIKKAFQSAKEAKDIYGLDDLQLYYNDYSLNNPSKREAAKNLVKMLKADNIEIDGIGMQAHYRLSSYLSDKKRFMNDFEDSIKEFTELGIDVQITELDIRVNDSTVPTDEFDVFHKDLEYKQAEMFDDIYRICRKYSLPWKSGAGVISNVTTWGIADDHSAHSTSTHKDYPLLFQKDHSEKEAIRKIEDFSEDQ